MSVYEVHLGSWMRVPEEGDRWLSYRELADKLVDYVQQMQEALGGIRNELGEQLLVLALECAARRQMVEQRDMETAVTQLFDAFNVWGLSCMGEQSNSLNMNNSFNCLAFALPS